MKHLKMMLLGVLAGLAVLSGAQAVHAQPTGTLVFDLKSYTSEAKMSKKQQTELEHAGVRWDMLDNNSLLISFVNERFVKADLKYLTRFGEKKSLELKAGRYTITCIGFEFNSTSRDVNKVLAKSAYFNNDVVTFAVQPGKTTTLEVSPVYKPESQMRLWVKLTMLMPDLKVRVLEDGTPQGDDVVINRRTDKSVAWNDYQGPLKF